MTYYERSLLRKETAAKRLGGDSFKPLDHCYLCLSRLNDPVACSHGHLFCRECAISNLITQKAGIESAKRELEAWGQREERERAEARQRARERVIRDFERGMGLSGGGTGIRIGEREISNGSGGSLGKVGEGEKETIESLASQAEEKAMRAIEAEQQEARKSKLAAFWLPSLAPEGRLTPIKDVKLETVCQAGTHPHPISCVPPNPSLFLYLPPPHALNHRRKTLLPVILHYPTPKSTTPTCPSCTKELSNASSSILLSSRKPAVPASDETKTNGEADEPPAKKKKKGKKDEAPFVCGHVVCKTCAETIVKPSGRCCVCEAEVDEAGRIPVGKEGQSASRLFYVTQRSLPGTGFAAAGGAEVKPDRIAFRV